MRHVVIFERYVYALQRRVYALQRRVYALQRRVYALQRRVYALAYCAITYLIWNTYYKCLSKIWRFLIVTCVLYFYQIYQYINSSIALSFKSRMANFPKCCYWLFRQEYNTYATMTRTLFLHKPEQKHR